MNTRFTPGPWLFEPMGDFDALHKLRGTTPEPHEGYVRSNSGDWAVSYQDGRICLVDFKGSAKRGMGYLAPDPEGMANARLIAAAPDMYEALEALVEATRPAHIELSSVRAVRQMGKLLEAQKKAGAALAKAKGGAR